ncbi:hypothetical protein M758_6G104100 [Ceratodon purpureus]|uniref:Uncharacterized protein n=1 Tax=Ceratodon purpureus TaxID=3225 RepID=A0A8T0HGC9_CERPU|nr:hypothetical protein KC19_6G107900 [Ceratodon purpureus]KAG0613456.1 hypothetical protein M758_6G104100 [Ceratodon purpureus]
MPCLLSSAMMEALAFSPRNWQSLSTNVPCQSLVFLLNVATMGPPLLFQIALRRYCPSPADIARPSHSSYQTPLEIPMSARLRPKLELHTELAALPALRSPTSSSSCLGNAVMIQCTNTFERKYFYG